jgi:glycosyltransferase involved in cell wall biosynthesis
VFIAEQVKGLREFGLDVHVHFVDRRNLGMRAYSSMLGPIQHDIRGFAPDLIHIMYGGVMADQLTRKISDRPRIITFHGSDLLGENLSGPVRKFISHYGIWCSRRAARRANGIVVVSSTLKRALPPGLDPTKVRVIPCGIDLERFRPLDRQTCREQLKWHPDAFHLLFPSHRNNTVKRPALALAAFELFKRSGVQAEFHFLEDVANAQVPVWMNASNALILTSAHEGSPTVIKEALACGLPVVSLDVGDVAERLKNVEGCYLATEDPADLASRLCLAHQRGRRIAGGEMVQSLSLQSSAAELAKFYQEITTEIQPCLRHSAVTSPISPQLQV